MPPVARREPTSRERLLHAVLEHVATHGMQDTTLRGLAAAIGSSHRMLTYHFGSRQNLLMEVSRAVERQQREAFATMLADSEASPLEVVRAMWARLADPSLAPQERLFFELYARALRGTDGGAGFAPEVVEAWIAPLTSFFERLGFTGEQAVGEARLAVAVTRGLLLDLLATGDREAVDQAMDRYVARFGV